MKMLVFLIGLSALAIGWVNVSGATEIDSWEFQCMPIYDTISEDELVGDLCTTEITTRFEGRDFVIYFAHNRNWNSPLVVSGPEELFIDAIVEVQGMKPVNADNCEIGLCYFELKKSRLLVQQFIKGISVHITISTDHAKTILDKELTLSGFLAAFWEFRTEVFPPFSTGWDAT
jgi:hypothetical protein